VRDRGPINTRARARRFFKVTPRGLRAARETQRALVALWRDLPQLQERPS
jgi:hypothetical protein